MDSTHTHIRLNSWWPRQGIRQGRENTNSMHPSARIAWMMHMQSQSYPDLRPWYRELIIIMIVYYHTYHVLHLFTSTEYRDRYSWTSSSGRLQSEPGRWLVDFQFASVGPIVISGVIMETLNFFFLSFSFFPFSFSPLWLFPILLSYW